MKSILRFHRVVACLLALMLLAGCSLTPESVLDVIAPTESPAPGADITFSETVEEVVEPLRLTYVEMDGTFSPFWAVKDGDRTVVSLTQLALISKDGSTAPSQIDVVSNDDGSTTVTISLREGITASDGTVLTADDLIFDYYVMLDASYDGPYKLNELPIRGLSAYWNGIDGDMYSKYVFLYDETYRGGKYEHELEAALERARSELEQQGIEESRWMNNQAYRDAYNALQDYDYDRAEEIRNAIETAWRQDAEDLVYYILDNYSSTLTLGTDYDMEDVRASVGLQVVYAMRERLFGAFDEDGGFTASSGYHWDLVTEFPTSDDFFDEMYAAYNGDAEQYWLIEGVGRPNMLEAVANDLVRRWASEDEDWRGWVESVSGIEKLDDNRVAVTLDYFDDAVLQTLTDIYLAPLSAYGDSQMFDIENNSFGFLKGDLRAVKANADIAVGAGEYVYVQTDIRTVYLDANENYWLGMSQIPSIILSKE